MKSGLHRAPFSPSPSGRGLGVKQDRGREGSRLPSLRTVRAVFPHTALQLRVSSPGSARCRSGFVQGEQPEFCEEGIRPALMDGLALVVVPQLVMLAQD